VELGICTGQDLFAEPIEGLDYLEVSVAPWLVPLADEDHFAARLAEARTSPVPVKAANSFLPGNLKSTGPDVDNDALDAYVRTVMRRARQMGIEIIVFGSGGSRRVPEGFEQAAAVEQIVGHLIRWGPMAEESGVTLAVEPLQKSDCNIITSVAEGAEICRRADHPNIRLLADTYHMAADADPPEAIAEAEGLIVHAHCAELQDRAPVGTHDEDLRPYFRALKAIGYQGGISIESSWKDRRQQAPAAMAALAKQIAEA